MPERPNILIFMTDQQHGGTVLPSHRLKAITPNLDRFREQSTTFTRTYCPSPHCCPSRASFFTGLYPSQHGVWHNINVANAISRSLYPSVRPWSLDMVDAGYRLAYAGKWHVCEDKDASAFGWDVVYPPGGHAVTPGDHEQQTVTATRRELQVYDRVSIADIDQPRGEGQILRPGYPVYTHYGTSDNPFNDTTCTEAGLEALDRLSRHEEPWCLYIGTLGPHDPYTPPARFLDLYPPDDLPPLPPTFHDDMSDKPALYRRTRARFDQLSEHEHRQAIRHYLAFCSYEDWLFGRVLDALEQSGQADNTWVLFLSDHGDYVADHGLWCKGLPAFDSAYHVPLMVRAPLSDTSCQGRGRSVDAFTSLVDLGPTILDSAGITSAQPMAGRSLMPWLTGQTPHQWRDALFFQTNGNETYGIQRGVMTDDWKLVFNSFDYDELYDLRSDPDQMRNLSGQPEYEPIRRELYTTMWRLMLDYQDTYVNPYIASALADYGPGMVKQVRP